MASTDLAETVADVKPKLRGWLHLGTAPLTLVAGIVLVALSPTTATRVGSAIFAGSAVLLFTVSAIYHRGTWSPRSGRFLRRFDHSNIFLLIAGSYTPFALLLLEGTPAHAAADRRLDRRRPRRAVPGVLDRRPALALHPDLHRARLGRRLLHPGFARGAELGRRGTAVLVLIIVGGGLYTLGGVVYAFQRPDPSPRWFGFHEVFHSSRSWPSSSHYVGVSLATYALR